MDTSRVQQSVKNNKISLRNKIFNGKWLPFCTKIFIKQTLTLRNQNTYSKKIYEIPNCCFQ